MKDFACYVLDIQIDSNGLMPADIQEIHRQIINEIEQCLSMENSI